MKSNKKDIYASVLEFINENELLIKGEKILLALSAGKDSMTMLDVFLQLRQDISIDLGVFHLNHMMRGMESDDDENFIKGIARKNKLEPFIHKFDFNANKPKELSFEEFAREKRYELLDRICRENKFQRIATAHNRDDNIETILMRILSGTGIHGLGGIDVKKGNIIRPLLFLSSKDIYEYLIDRNLKWREDSSNKEEKYLRNFLRNAILPKINERFKGAEESILTLSLLAREYVLLIDELLAEKGELYLNENNSVIIESRKYISDKKLFKYIISKAIRENFCEFVTKGMLEEIYKKAITNKTHMLLYKNRGFILRKTLKNNKKVIVISRNIEYNNIEWEYKIDLRPDSGKNIFIKEIDKKIFFELVDYDSFKKNKELYHIIFIAVNEDIKDVMIRNRRKGDRIRLGQGSKKIKELMIDNKFDKQMKESSPLLIAGSCVAAFMPGFLTDISNRVSVDFLVKRGSKRIFAVYDDALPFKAGAADKN